jgi:hypothetical protein
MGCRSTSFLRVKSTRGSVTLKEDYCDSSGGCRFLSCMKTRRQAKVHVDSGRIIMDAETMPEVIPIWISGESGVFLLVDLQDSADAPPIRVRPDDV